MSRLEERIKLTLSGLDHDIDEVLYALEYQVSEMRLAGMSDEVIYAWFSTPEAIATFRNRLVNDLQRRLSASLNQLASNAYMEQTEGLAEIWSWHKEPTAENCPTCIANDSMPPMSMKKWQDFGAPGAGATICDGGCRCILLPEAA